MDDLATNNNSSSSNSSSSTATTATGNIAVVVSNVGANSQSNGLSYYELALKKLNHILKSKANDVGKQLEELWDSINHSTGHSAASHQAGAAPKAAVVTAAAAKLAIGNGKSVVTLPLNRLSPLNFPNENSNEAANTVSTRTFLA